jgi:hypothetical protein
MNIFDEAINFKKHHIPGFVWEYLLYDKVLLHLLKKEILILGGDIINETDGVPNYLATLNWSYDGKSYKESNYKARQFLESEYVRREAKAEKLYIEFTFAETIILEWGSKKLTFNEVPE